MTFEVFVFVICLIVAVWQMYKISMTDAYKEIQTRENVLMLVAIVACIMLLWM